MINYLGIDDKKQVSLDILVAFDKFCVQNNISYYLAYGTLLGAVRHKGFIPWDDDIDVWLMRADYERLRDLWNNSRYNFCDCYTMDKYGLTYAKIQDTRTAAIRDNVQLDEGLGIDLFPLDYLPDDRHIAEKKYVEFRNRANLIHRKIWAYSTENNINGVRKLLGELSSNSGWNNYTARIVDKQAKKHFSKITNHCGAATDMYPSAFTFFSLDYFESIKLQFENYEFTAPVGYDSILRMLYGDYMRLPPEEKRVSTHEVEFIWKE